MNQDINRDETFDASNWVELHGDALFGFAFVRVRDAATAEDLVQEALVAGVKAGPTFDGRANERTWLMSILKHKIVDHFRRIAREAPLTEEESDMSSYDYLFANRGHWTPQTKPIEWGSNPAAHVEQAEFRKILSGCMDELPERVAKCFALREMDGHDTSTICELLGISTSNFWVIMHRARLHLRRCIEFGWYRKVQD